MFENISVIFNFVGMKKILVTLILFFSPVLLTAQKYAATLEQLQYAIDTSVKAVDNINEAGEYWTGIEESLSLNRDQSSMTNTQIIRIAYVMRKLVAESETYIDKVDDYLDKAISEAYTAGFSESEDYALSGQKELRKAMDELYSARLNFGYAEKETDFKEILNCLDQAVKDMTAGGNRVIDVMEWIKCSASWLK